MTEPLPGSGSAVFTGDIGFCAALAALLFAGDGVRPKRARFEVTGGTGEGKDAGLALAPKWVGLSVSYSHMWSTRSPYWKNFCSC